MEVYFIIFVVFHFILLKVNADIRECQFVISTNISSSKRLQNGSYLLRDLGLPDHLTGDNYIETEWRLYENISRHLRGCVCEIWPCLRICCHHKEMQSNGECTFDLKFKLFNINPFLNMTFRKRFVEKRNALFKKWSEQDVLWSRSPDCLHANPVTSSIAFRNDPFENINPPGTFALISLSQVFLTLTIAVYAYVKKLRNLHGKCFICYMITTFMWLLYNQLDTVEIPLKLCVLYCHSLYFFIMARFTWLLALSYQMWNGFASVNRAESEYSFRAYNIFAWGTPFILTGLSYLVEMLWYGESNKEMRIVGVGLASCDPKGDITLIVSICILTLTISALNNTLFVLTIICIIKVKLSLKYFSDQDERARNHKLRMEMFPVFLRLFILMYIQNSVTVISVYSDWELLYVICVYSNFCIGMTIFVLFILKRTTIQLLMESIRSGRN